MTDTLLPYPDYKNSGVPWLGDIPNHWSVQRLRRISTKSALYGANLSASLYVSNGVRFIRTTDISDDGVLRKNGVYIPFENVKGYILEDEDLLISRSGTVGRAFLYKKSEHGICAYAGYLVRFVLGNTCIPKYVFYYTKSQSFTDFIKLSSIQSTIDNVNGDKYANSPIPLPPLEEQAAIVRFLDAADQRIRRYIRAKQRLIGLLNEQKQAIIQQAVTRGLDPDVPLKPSGVEWLGDIPAHWEVVHLRYLATKFGSGITPRGGAQIYQSSGIPFLRSQNVYFDGLRLKKVAYIPESLHKELNATHVHPGDVLLNITGASIGRACVVPADFLEGNVNQHVCIIRPRQQMLQSEFLAQYIATGTVQKQIYVSQHGSSREGLNLQEIRSLEITLPDLKEQQQIVWFVNEQTRHLGLVITKYEQQISLIREYRTRLIADVVTGKIDVRTAAFDLPETFADDPALLAELDALPDDDPDAIDPSDELATIEDSTDAD